MHRGDAEALLSSESMSDTDHTFLDEYSFEVISPSLCALQIADFHPCFESYAQRAFVAVSERERVIRVLYELSPDDLQTLLNFRPAGNTKLEITD